MRRLIALLFLACVSGIVVYHQSLEWREKIDLRPGQIQSDRLYTGNLFIRYFLDPKIDICFDSNLTDQMSFRLYNVQGTISNTLNISKQGLTLINPSFFYDPNWTVRGGVRVIMGENNTGVSGNFRMMLCRNVTYFEPDSNKTDVAQEPLDLYDSTIHIPFFSIQSMNSTVYVDFSTILPKRALTKNDWMTNGFCINSTLSGSVKMHMSRCRSHDPHVIDIAITDERTIERYWPWEKFILEEHKCPVEEEVLPDHLWIVVESMDHSGMGEIVIYNCHHTWVSNSKGEEVIKIRPTLDREDTYDALISYAVMPYRKTIHFSPLKHMMDTAFVLGNVIRYAFEHGPSAVISFSACYNSTRYTLPTVKDKRVGKLTEVEIHLLSEFSNELNCPEEKRHGFYIHAGADSKQIIDGIRLWTYKRFGAYTPTGRLKNDVYTTVAFNLRRGVVISRNVDVFDLFDQAEDSNGYATLNFFFNATGNVKLSVSRCRYSTRIRLFDEYKMGSLVVNNETVQLVKSLYDENECLSDFQPTRYEFKGQHKTGIYFHVEAMEDSIGYIAPYHTFGAKLLWHQLNEEYKVTEWPDYMKRHSETTAFKPIAFPMPVRHLIQRARMNRDISLRFSISCPGPCKIAFTACREDEVSEWKQVTALPNQTHALYSFDLEGVEYLNAFAVSQNCVEKGSDELYVQLSSETNITARMEFSVVNGRDLNQVDPCHTAETVELKKTEAQLKTKILHLEVALVVVFLIGIAAAFLIYRFILGRKKQDTGDGYQMLSLASASL